MFRDYSNYEIFADGRIWSKVRKKFLKPYTTKDGYQQVCLIDNEGKRHQEYVHRVVFCAVNGLWNLPEGLQINHKNEFQKHQNAIWNLELVTPKQNINYGTHNARVAKTLSKRVGAYDKNGDLVMAFQSIAEAGRQGFSQGVVCKCCRNCYCGGNKYKGYTWKYLEDN